MWAAPFAWRSRVKANLCTIAVAFKRYGSSALRRKKRGSNSGMLAKSFSTDADSSGVAPTIFVETESIWRRSFIAAIVTRIECPTCRTMASVVTWAVIFGFPSRSPPIQLPKDSGRAVIGISTSMRFISFAKSLRTSGTVCVNKSSR